MLYVIAKINGRYRSLAVLYRHYDNKGERAVETCRRLIEIFEEPANRSLLLHEIQIAGKLPPEKWEANPEYCNERPAFPFIATCLMLGASVAPKTGKGYNATHEPFNMPLAAFDEGCTILDVTDPAAVRYAFAFILPQRTEYEGIIKTTFGNTPLTAWEYMEFYSEPFVDRVYRGGGNDAAVAKTHADLMEVFKGQAVVDTTIIPSSLIDEDTLESTWPHLSDQQSWKRRADLGLPKTVPRPSPVRGPALPSLPTAHHGETLYKAFEQSYKLFEPEYNEGLDTEILAPVSPIKQVVNILHFGSLEESSWQARAAEYEPKDGRCFRENGVQYFTFQVDDAPVTPGLTLDVLHGWMVAASTQQEYGGRRHYDYYLDCTNSQSDQNILKFFGLAGPVRNVP